MILFPAQTAWGIILSNNIGVDPKAVCHTEHSEVSLFSAFSRSFTFVQDDKFTQKMKHGSTAILLLNFIINIPHSISVGYSGSVEILCGQTDKLVQ